MSEKQHEKAILQYLSCFPEIFYWQHSNVGVYDPVNKRYYKPNFYSRKGVSDILGVMPGKAFAIEVKSPTALKYVRNNYDELWKGTHTTKQKIHLQNQILFIEGYKKRGHIGFFAATLEDVDEGLGLESKRL